MTERQFEKAVAVVLCILVCLLLMGYQENFPAPEPEEERIEVLDDEEKYSFLGTFEAEVYCAEDFPHECNEQGKAVTTMCGLPVPGRTVAVDPAVIPLGSLIKVKCGDEEWILTANDTSESIKGRTICLAVATHEEVYKWQTKPAQVWMIEEGETVYEGQH